MNYIERLKRMRACNDALIWLRKNDFPTLQAAWEACERADWMLWLIYHTSDHHDESTMEKYTSVMSEISKYYSFNAISRGFSNQRESLKKQAQIIRWHYPKAPDLMNGIVI